MVLVFDLEKISKDINRMKRTAEETSVQQQDHQTNIKRLRPSSNVECISRERDFARSLCDHLERLFEDEETKRLQSEQFVQRLGKYHRKLQRTFQEDTHTFFALYRYMFFREGRENLFREALRQTGTFSNIVPEIFCYLEAKSYLNEPVSPTQFLSLQNSANGVDVVLSMIQDVKAAQMFTVVIGDLEMSDFVVGILESVAESVLTGANLSGTHDGRCRISFGEPNELYVIYLGRDYARIRTERDTIDLFEGSFCQWSNKIFDYWDSAAGTFDKPYSGNPVFLCMEQYLTRCTVLETKPSPKEFLDPTKGHWPKDGTKEVVAIESYCEALKHLIDMLETAQEYFDDFDDDDD